VSEPIAFVDLSPQWRQIRPAFLKKLEGICSRSQFVLSEVVAEFENAFAEYCATACCVGVNSGTDALTLALRALEIGPEDEVILPVNTFAATAESVCHAGGTPVFIDVDAATKSLDPKALEAAVGPRTRAVVPVHLYGNPAPMDDVLRIAGAAGIAVVEDAAQAQGAWYGDARVGSMGVIAAFSFYPGKNLGALGDAGAVVTSDLRLDERLRRLRNHGGVQRYEHATIGYNSRLDAIQAAALLCKLPHLDRWNRERRKRAALYTSALGDLSWLRIPEVTPQGQSVYHLFTVELADPGLERDRLLEWLGARGIQCGIHYPLPLHELEAFRHLPYREGEFPVAEQTARNHLSLPMHPFLPANAIVRVAEEIRAFARA
jgi:dTDP-4-amino-4,6-dideoxygalactose transaminase